ncbi:hypothetical protein [Chitinivorax sp. B]|uniref:hypothetical protein n=1 Tax=Chitinivorax sp. B TaxID=2502235 RepID=UPI0010F72A7A|nr:hypothetical protein [Chitinivorax sp. B]
MKTDLLIDFVWIPSDLGGHSVDPYSGMRLSIRWQRYLEAHLQCMRDVECQVMTFDSITSRGRALCVLSAEAELPAEWLQEGQLVELLNGFRVLAVGKVTS